MSLSVPPRYVYTYTSCGVATCIYGDCASVYDAATCIYMYDICLIGDCAVTERKFISLSASYSLFT